MSSTCCLDFRADTDLDSENWVFLKPVQPRSTGPAAGAVRSLRIRSRSARPVLQLANVPEYGSGDAELASDLESVVEANWR